MRTRNGFTLIELIVSMAVMTVGTASLFALQGYIARSNLHSKEITIATSIAENWVERIKMDALNWTLPGDAGNPGINLNNTQYLKEINDSEDEWHVPANGYNALLGHAPGTDADGIEISNWPPNDSSEINYCTNILYVWVETGSSIRADIRVFWPKRPSAAEIGTDFPLCENEDGDLTNYHVVYTSTIVRWTPTSL